MQLYIQTVKERQILAGYELPQRAARRDGGRCRSAPRRPARAAPSVADLIIAKLWYSLPALPTINRETTTMLFCITADYTSAALNAMRENPNTNRQAALEQLLSAAGENLLRFTARLPMVLARW